MFQSGHGNTRCHVRIGHELHCGHDHDVVMYKTFAYFRPTNGMKAANQSSLTQLAGCGADKQQA